MQLKQLGVTLALAGMPSTQAYAHEAAVSEAAPLAAAAVQAAPANVLTQDDLVALFGAQEAQKPLQLALLSEQEMKETEGAFAFVPFLAWSLTSAAASAWAYHGRSYYNTGNLGTSAGAAWAAASGFLGGIHGRGLAAGARLIGWQRGLVGANGFGVSTAWNAANPWRR
jgi:hypothetical protein